jgi:putative Ca2+/H+ antiporter (TMEM165/GDT1 family)
MDWKIAVTAFSTLFLAEMGDKTQLAVITLSASSRKPFSVFAGSAAALICVTAIGSAFGRVLQRIVATAFIGIGAWMWVKP